MVDVNKLKRAGKGTPPPARVMSGNLLKPERSGKVPFQVKIAPELRREFKVYAAEREIDASTLFAHVWAYYIEHHG